MRAGYLWQTAEHPRFETPIVDSAAYHRAAQALVGTGRMPAQFFWQAFFYPLFVSSVYLACGVSIFCLRMVQLALGSLLCAGVVLLGRRLCDARTGFVAGIVCALYGPLILFQGELVAAGWAAVWAAALLGLALRVEARPGWTNAAALGVCGGLAIVTRATFLPFFAALVAWLPLAWRRRGVGRAGILAAAGAAPLGALVVLLPVAHLCHQATGRFSPLPETGALNLYMGNRTEPARYMAVRPGAEWMELLLLPARHGAEPGAEERRFYMRRLIDDMQAHPACFAAGLARKTAHFLSSREIPSNFDPYAMRAHSSLLGALMWRAGRFGFPFGLLLPLALVGLLCRRPAPPAPALLFLLLYPASIVLVFVTARYRVPVVPVLAVYAAAGMWQLHDLACARRWRRAGGLVAACVAVAVLTSAAGPFPAEQSDYEAEMCFSLGSELQQDGRFEEAIAWYRKGLERNPDFSEAYNNLALIRVRQGRFDDAVALYKRAIELAPEHFWYHQNLGAALMQAGRVTEGIPHYLRAMELAPGRPEDALRRLDRGSPPPGSPPRTSSP